MKRMIVTAILSGFAVSAPAFAGAESTNPAPQVSLSAEQDTVTTHTITAGDGPVTVVSSVHDTHANIHTYDWSTTDKGLVDTDKAPRTFTFDPSGLSPGQYTVRLKVSRDGTATTEAVLKLKIVGSVTATTAPAPAKPAPAPVKPTPVPAKPATNASTNKRYWKIGVSIGQAKGNTGTGAINSQLASSGLNATASSSSDKRTAWLASVGYVYTPQWEADLSYVNLGKVSTTFSGTAVSIDTFLSASHNIHPNTATGLKLSGTYRYAIGSSQVLYVMGRLGIFSWRSKYTLNGVTQTQKVNTSGNSATYGLGLEEKLLQHLAIDADWDAYKINSQSINMLSLGLVYSFM